jgi:hypothetical protein
MIQVVGVALLAVGGLYAWSALKREMKRLDSEDKDKRDDKGEPLEYDPAAKRYRARGKGGERRGEQG